MMLLLIVSVGCATTPPEGKLQLTPEIETYNEDHAQRKKVVINKGRPIHIPAWSYGHITPDGDIWAGGPVLFFIGREELSFDHLMNDMGKNKNHDEKEQ